MNIPAYPGNSQSISIHSKNGALYGTLALPADASALVLIASADPSAPSALPTPNAALAETLHYSGLATLSIDLITPSEERFADVHSNVPLLAKRLVDCLALIKQQMQVGELPKIPLCLYGARHCAPVVLRVAALRDDDISALVCHNGLIDLAGALYLRSLRAPLLITVDEVEMQLIGSNRRAIEEVHCRKSLKIIPATSSTSAAAPAESAARQAAQWFGENSRTAL